MKLRLIAATLSLPVLVIAAVAMNTPRRDSPVAHASNGIIVDLGDIGFETGFGSIVVDDTYGHVFVSGPTRDEVVVLDLTGNIVKTFSNQYGAAGMVISGSRLYVAQRSGGAIEQIDLATLADEGPLVTGLASPIRLAFAGGKLWTGVNGGFGWGQLASVSLSGGVAIFSPNYYALDLASSPRDPNALYLAEDGLSRSRPVKWCK